MKKIEVLGAESATAFGTTTRIMLVIPPTTIRNSINKRLAVPVGLYRLKSDLENIKIDLTATSRDYVVYPQKVNNIEVKILDSPAEGYDQEIIFEHEGYNLKTFGLTAVQILDQIREFEPTIIGISSQYLSQYQNALDIAKAIKSAFPEVKTILGGINASSCHLALNNKEDEKMLEQLPFENGIDYIISGPADLNLPRLVTALSELSEESLENYLSEIPGLRFRRESEIIVGSSGKRKILNPDELPSIDYREIPKNLYTADKFHAGKAKTSHFMDWFSSEGCNLNCSFCATRFFWGCYRPLSMEKIERELTAIKDAGFTEICVHDDSIFTEPSRAIKIFETIKKVGFQDFTCIGGLELKQMMARLERKNRAGSLISKITADCDKNGYPIAVDQIVEIKPSHMRKFVSQFDQIRLLDTTAKLNWIKSNTSDWDITITEANKSHDHFLNLKINEHLKPVREVYDGGKIIDSMGKIGCYRIYLSVESINKETLNAVGKDRSLPSDNCYSPIQVASMLDQAGIESHFGVMLGHPEIEGIPEILNCIRFGKDLVQSGMSRPSFFPYKLLPGIKLANDNLKRNFAFARSDMGGYPSFDFTQSNINSLVHKWTAEEINFLYNWGNNLLDGASWTIENHLTSEEKQKKFTSQNNNFEKEISRFLNEENLFFATIAHLESLAQKGEADFDALKQKYINALHSVGREVPPD